MIKHVGSHKEPTEFLVATDRFAKTIIFCENVDHAERMRQAMVNANPDLAAANGKFFVNGNDAPATCHYCKLVVKT